MKLTKHNVEQMARGYLMYQLARHGYNVQVTDSRFPTYDLLLVSPMGETFGIEVKGSSNKNYWRFDEREPRPDMYYAFVFVPQEGAPRVFIMDSSTAMKLRKQNRDKGIKRGATRKTQWGMNWTQPQPYEDKYNRLPQ